MKHYTFKLLWIVLVVFIAVALPRWYYIENYAVSLPFYDQWDAEGDFLLKPWIQGKLSISALWQPHNEHRIFPTRLLAILAFEMTGYWNNLTLARLNIPLAALTPVLLTIIMFRNRDLHGEKWIMLLVIIAGSALPFSWENIVTGFQNQFYFIVLFTFSALAIAALRPLNVLEIIATFTLCVLCVITMASGLITAVAVATVYIMKCYMKRRFPLSALFVIALFLIIGIIGYITMPYVSTHEMYHPQNVWEICKAVIRILTWPLVRQYWALIPLWFPASISAILLFYKKRFTQTDLLMAGIYVWVLFQTAAIAYGRGQYLFELSSRYTDLISLGLISNAWFVLRLKDEYKSNATRFTAIIFFAVFAFGHIYRFNSDLDAMKSHYESCVKQISNVRSYLITKNKSYLFSKPKSDIPYPYPERLQMLLDDQIIQSILAPLEDKSSVEKVEN